MGNSQDIPNQSARQQYLQLLEKRKHRYARQNTLHLSISPLKDWKRPIISALETSETEYIWAYWPLDLRKLVWEWNYSNDSKWRSNMLWFDYLNTHKTTTNTEIQPQNRLISPLFSTDMQAKSLLDYIRSHICYKNKHSNVISGLICAFAESFQRFYTDVAGGKEEELAVDIVEMADFRRVICEIKRFVEVLLVSFESYYGGEELGQLIKRRAVDIVAVLTDEVMHTGVYHTLLRIYSAANAEKETRYQQKIKENALISCEEMGISYYFCIDSNPESEGYTPAIDLLRTLTAVTSPLAKLEIVIKTTKKLCECVDLYWTGRDVQAEQLVINADMILSIFSYIVVKARVRNLMGHVALMVEFVKEDVQNGPFGYYLATLEAAVEHICVFPSSHSNASTFSK